MDTSAIYPNRVKDKEKVESDLELLEFPKLDVRGTLLFKTKGGTDIARGYRRVVYGDHGPYVEFDESQVFWDNFKCTRRGIGYYDKWYSEDGVMLYDQLKTVAHLPNPPAGRFSFRGSREEGYADYLVGKIYVDPYLCKIWVIPQDPYERCINGRHHYDACDHPWERSGCGPECGDFSVFSDVHLTGDVNQERS